MGHSADPSASHRSASVAISRPVDKSFRVSKLATQIKDSVITSFGPSRVLALSTGLSKITKNLNLVVCKAFYKWLHHSRPERGSGGAMTRRVSVSSPSDKLAAMVFKNFMHRSYANILRVALFRWVKQVGMPLSSSLLPEPELREENKRLRRKSELLQPGEKTTMGMVRRRLAMVFSASVRASVRKSFDRWRSMARILSYRIEMQRQHIKVEIGMQHIRSEKEKINNVREENNKLQNWLLCSIFFLKWKVQEMNQKLLSEKDVRFKEREIVYKRVSALKSKLVRAQQIERDAVATAALRGAEFCQRLKALQLEFDAPDSGVPFIESVGNGSGDVSNAIRFM